MFIEVGEHWIPTGFYCVYFIYHIEDSVHGYVYMLIIDLSIKHYLLNFMKMENTFYRGNYKRSELIDLEKSFENFFILFMNSEFMKINWFFITFCVRASRTFNVKIVKTKKKKNLTFTQIKVMALHGTTGMTLILVWRFFFL